MKNIRLNPTHLFTIAGIMICVSFQPTYSHQKKQHFISATAGQHGKISATGKIPVDQGGEARFRITPDEGWQADSVIVDGINQGRLSTYMFQNVSDDHTIRATFAKISPDVKKVAAISTTAGAHGRVSPEGNQYVSLHGSINFSIAADSGYVVDSVLVDGGYVGPLKSYSFTNVMYDHVLVATFIKKKE